MLLSPGKVRSCIVLLSIRFIKRLQAEDALKESHVAAVD
jgi:hypothetical protein